MAPGAIATLTHLNDDTSWLLTLPGDLPDSKYTIVIDPWLSGSQTDYFPLFSRQTHVAAPAFSSLPELTASVGKIDGIVCSHEFTDHCHEDTLRTAASDVLVWAHPRAKQRIEGWRVFERPVGATPIAGKSWSWTAPTQPRFENEDEVPTLPGKTLRQMGQEAGWDVPTLAACPDHISLLYIPTDDRFDPAGDRLHGLTIISFFEPENPTLTYSIVYSPHGLPPTAAAPLVATFPPCTTHRYLALIHHYDRLTMPLLGVVNIGPKLSGLPLVQALRPAKWIRTHDEEKKAEGLVGRILKRERGSKAAVEALLKEAGVEGVDVVVLKSGESEEL